MLKRMISMLLCIAMVAAMLPTQAVALDSAEPTGQVETDASVEPTAPPEVPTEPTGETTSPADDVPDSTENTAVPDQTEPGVISETTGSDLITGTHGTNVTWTLEEATGVLTVSGYGAIAAEYSGTVMPWYPYREKITAVKVEAGITEIPAYTFEHLRSAAVISLPNTLTTLALNAFNNCESLNNLLIPAAVQTITSSGSDEGMLLFNRCSALTDVYYLGTVEEWSAFPYSDTVVNTDADITMHFLTLHENPPTCTESGTQSYYTFDDTSVHSRMYDLEKNVILEPKELPALGHDCDADGVCTNCGIITGTCGDALTWVLDSSGILTISGTGDMSFSISPWQEHRDKITKVILEYGVTSICMDAFYRCTNLTEIDIADSVTRIGSYAFAYCTGLKRIYIPASVTRISEPSSSVGPFLGMSDYAVIYCEANSAPAGWYSYWNFNATNSETTLTTHYGYTRDEYSWWSTISKNGFHHTLEIPDYITRIPDHALSGYHVTHIIIPDSVTSIEKNAFENCTGLKSIYIPSSVETISAEFCEDSPFYGCSPDMKIYCEASSVPSGWEGCWCYYSCDEALNWRPNYTREEYVFWLSVGISTESITIPEYITSIPEDAFANNPYLTSIVIPDSVTTIGKNAFLNCTALKRIYIPDSVTTIEAQNYEDSPFYGCNNHLTIYCESSSALSGWDNYWNCYSNAMLYVVYQATPEEFSFWDTINRQSTELIIPDYITRIPAQAFLECWNLADVTLHDAVTAIEPRAFANCGNLKTIYLPSSVTTISAPYLSRSPFYNCSSDLVVYCGASSAQSGWDSYWNAASQYSNLKVYYQCSHTDYLCWKALDHSADAFIISEGISQIPESMFSACYNLTSVTIPASVTNIGDNAFANCYNLTDVYFGGTWNQWNDVVIGDNNSYLRNAAVHYGINPTSGSFGENLSWEYDTASATLRISGTGAIPDYENRNQPWGQWMGSISQIVIEDGVSALGSNAFYGVQNVSVSVAGSVTAIHDAFRNTQGVQFSFGGTMRQWANLDNGRNGQAVCADGTVIACGSFGHYEDGTGEWIATGTWYLTETGVFYVDGGGQGILDSELHLFNDRITAMVILEGTKEVSGRFGGAYNLREITIPGTLKKLDLGLEHWFERINITDLAAWCELDCIHNLSGTLYLDGNRITNLVVPETVTRIGRYALANKNDLRNITIPGSVTEIADFAFAQSYNLNAIRFLGNAPSIGENAFQYLEIAIYYPSNDSSWEWYAQQTFGGNEIHWYSLDNVAGTCGWNCTWSLQNGKLTVTGNGSTNHYSPENPTPWTILADLIQEIYVDHSVYGIGENAFSGLTRVNRVVIGDNISWIYTGAFSGCTALTEITFLGGAAYDVAEDVFSGVTATAHYPAGWGWSEGNLQNFGGNLTWVEDGVALRKIIMYTDLSEAAVGQIFYMGASFSPWNASVDFTFSVSDPEILEIVSLEDRSCTIKALSEGTASVIARDRRSGLETVREITVIQPPPISCPHTEEVPVPEGDSTTHYSFTPAEDGLYSFSCTDIETMLYGDYGISLHLYGDGHYVEAIYTRDGNRQVITAELSTDVTYTVYLPFYGSAYEQTSTFQVEQVSAYPESPEEPPEESEFGFYQESIETKFMPGEETMYHLSLSNPDSEDVIWTSSDPAIIVIESSYPDYCQYNVLNPGTATITASCNGKSDSVTITATAIDILELYVSETLTSEDGYIYKSYGFMAPEDGRFVFTVSYDSGEYASIGFNSWSSDDNMSYSYGTNYRSILRDMAAGEICRFYVNCVSSSCSVRVNKASSRPLSMQVVQLSDYPGTVSFGVGFNPRNSSERIVKWEISDPTVVGETNNPYYHSSHYDNQISYTVYKDGQVTVTATSESGLKANLTVTVHANACENGHFFGAWYPVLDNDGNETDTERRDCENCTDYQERRIRPLDETVENRVVIDATEVAGHSTVWIDGAEYSLHRNGSKCYVDLPDSNARTMVTYTYSSNAQTQYPVGMKVWMLENENGIYTITRQEIFDDILQYSGMSIRVTGKKGIRMITSIEKDKKNALVSDGLEGYALQEYGTVVAWASQLSDGKPLVLGKSYAKSNHAYKKDVADPVFAYSGSLMQYTNVLVNFSDEQCRNDLAMRPYMILEDSEGNTVTLYGGIVYRSIGYIAYQNRNVFEPQTEEYNYIWDIIHYVYGDVHDDEFIHAWTPSIK